MVHTSLFGPQLWRGLFIPLFLSKIVGETDSSVILAHFWFEDDLVEGKDGEAREASVRAECLNGDIDSEGVTDSGDASKPNVH